MTSAALGAVALWSLARPAPMFAACGGAVDGSEQCDGADLGGQTCTDVTSGFAQGGTLACKADCTFETSDCRRAFIAGLIPATGGPAKNRCHLEWGTVGTTSKGRNTKRVCNEGDDTCDVDLEFNNSCTFRIQVCMNVPDERLSSCAAGRIVKLDVLQPSLAIDVGKEVASAVLAAAQRAAPEQAHVSGGSASFGPPVTEFTCGKVRSVGAITFTCMP